MKNTRTRPHPTVAALLTGAAALVAVTVAAQQIAPGVRAYGAEEATARGFAPHAPEYLRAPGSYAAARADLPDDPARRVVTAGLPQHADGAQPRAALEGSRPVRVLVDWMDGSAAEEAAPCANRNGPMLCAARYAPADTRGPVPVTYTVADAATGLVLDRFPWVAQ